MMRSLNYLTDKEVLEADSIMLEGSEIDHDDLDELIKLARDNNAVYKYSIYKNDCGKIVLDIW